MNEPVQDTFVIKGPEATPETEVPELSKKEQAQKLVQEMTDSALESDISRKERKARTAKHKSAHRSRMANVSKSSNRSRSGRIKR